MRVGRVIIQWENNSLVSAASCSAPESGGYKKKLSLDSFITERSWKIVSNSFGCSRHGTSFLKLKRHGGCEKESGWNGRHIHAPVRSDLFERSRLISIRSHQSSDHTKDQITFSNRSVDNDSERGLPLKIVAQGDSLRLLPTFLLLHIGDVSPWRILPKL